MARIGRWFTFKRDNGTLPVLKEISPRAPDQPGQIETARPKPRSFFWRPWARRDAAIASVQQGFDSLAELMASIRQNLESQSRRQDEMLGYLSHLPQLLEALPESQRAHGETLKAIGQQLTQQTQQHERVAEILDRLGDGQGAQQQILQTLAGRSEMLSEHNQMISANLRHVGSAMESMGKSSESSAAVLRQINAELATRDGQLEKIIQRQNTRLTLLLTLVAGSIIAAAAAIALVGFMLLHRG